MSFDQANHLEPGAHPPQHVVDLHKKTTKVNAGIIAAVIFFFLATAGVVAWTFVNGERVSAVKHEVNTKP